MERKSRDEMKIGAVSLLLIMVLMMPQARAASQAGIIEESIRAKVNRAGSQSPLVGGMAVYLGEVVETGTNGYARLRLLDDSQFTIGPQSSVVIDEFVYNPGESGGKIHAAAVRGLFRFVTGKISTKKPNNMEIVLPTGSIGVRGTTVGGEIRGMRTMVILLKSESTLFPRAHVGHVIVRNKVKDQVHETHLRNTDYASVIEGSGQAPSPAFRVKDEQVRDFYTRLNTGRDPNTKFAKDSDTAFDEYVAVQNSALGQTSYRLKPQEEKRSKDTKKKKEEKEEKIVPTVKVGFE